MSDTQDQGLFNDEPAEVELDETVSYKDQLVGEGKKYKDDEALARSRIEADKFIDRIQRENALLRGEIQKRETTEELIQRLTKTQVLPKDTATDDERHEPGSANKDGLTLEDIDQRLDQKLSAKQEQERRSNNARAVRDELVKRYGPNWQTHLRARQSELDVSEQYLTELAQTQPKIFFSLLGEAPKREIGFTPPSPAIDTTKRPMQGSVKNKAYYDKLRRENFSEFMSPRVQNEMIAQADRLGDQFFS